MFGSYKYYVYIAHIIKKQIDMNSKSILIEKIKSEREYYLDLYNKADASDRNRYYEILLILDKFLYE